MIDGFQIGNLLVIVLFPISSIYLPPQILLLIMSY
jgi:hypothetical protein